MARRGRYSKKRTPIDQFRWSFKRRWRWFKKLSKFKKILLIFGPVIAFLLITPLVTYLYFARDINNQERLMNRNNTGVVVLDKNGKPFYSFGRAQHREIVPLDQIADVTEHALIASEDKNFYEHEGFSILSILSALYTNFTLQNATAYGGSTLTQQLAKNTLLSNDKTIIRKYQELTIAIAIEQNYSKDEILDMYLNSVYFGEGAFGIKEAAATYFGKEPSQLTLAESSMLIGILPAPSAYSPTSGDPKLAKQRQETVLSRMVENGYITAEQKQAALAVELTYASADEEQSGVAPHFAQMVMEQLYEKYGEEKVTRSGYQVYTGLDMTLQKSMQQHVDNQMPHIISQGGSNASAIAIDPKTGEIRALIGSADWNNKEFGKVNMATTPRQPGSSFKPIYYSEALAKGIVTPATVIEDKATNFNGYKPLNATRQFYGDVTVRSALAMSLNIPAVKVMQKLGVGNAVDAAQRMGISTVEDGGGYGLSLALGTAEARLDEMTNAYAAFANQGQQHDIVAITKIKDKFDRTIFAAETESEEVLSKPAAFLISDILSDNTARAPMFGAALTVYGRDVAVKTGTTDDSRDAWTIGYTPQIAIGVWVGNNDNQPMISGGSDMAGPIWRQSMQSALEGKPVASFMQPVSVTERLVCAKNGKLATRQGPGVYSEFFLESALPDGFCEVDKPKKDKKDDKNKQKDDSGNKLKDDQPQPTVPEDPTMDPENPGGGNDGEGGDPPINPPTPPEPPTPPTLPDPPSGGNGGP